MTPVWLTTMLLVLSQHTPVHVPTTMIAILVLLIPNKDVSGVKMLEEPFVPALEPLDVSLHTTATNTVKHKEPTVINAMSFQDVPGVKPPHPVSMPRFPPVCGLTRVQIVECIVTVILVKTLLVACGAKTENAEEAPRPTVASFNTPATLTAKDILIAQLAMLLLDVAGAKNRPPVSMRIVPPAC